MRNQTVQELHNFRTDVHKKKSKIPRKLKLNRLKARIQEESKPRAKARINLNSTPLHSLVLSPVNHTVFAGTIHSHILLLKLLKNTIELSLGLRGLHFWRAAFNCVSIISSIQLSQKHSLNEESNDWLGCRNTSFIAVIQQNCLVCIYYAEWNHSNGHAAGHCALPRLQMDLIFL